MTSSASPPGRGSPSVPRCGSVIALLWPFSNRLTLPTPPRSRPAAPPAPSLVEKIELDRTRAEAELLSDGLPDPLRKGEGVLADGEGEKEGRSDGMDGSGGRCDVEPNLARVGDPGVPNRTGEPGCVGE